MMMMSTSSLSRSLLRRCCLGSRHSSLLPVSLCGKSRSVPLAALRALSTLSALRSSAAGARMSGVIEQIQRHRSGFASAAAARRRRGRGRGRPVKRSDGEVEFTVHGQQKPELEPIEELREAWEHRDWGYQRADVESVAGQVAVDEAALEAEEQQRVATAAQGELRDHYNFDADFADIVEGFDWPFPVQVEYELMTPLTAVDAPRTNRSIRKCRLTINMNEVPMDKDQLAVFVDLATVNGSLPKRYNPDTGVLTIVSDRYGETRDNLIECCRIVHELINESARIAEELASEEDSSVEEQSSSTSTTTTTRKKQQVASAL
eukprot:TRINITY_DN56186_c0_g1_i1.p1 TRINITY_DN56186_c0_g1~~TRINITY_DN56186_c0_g1_i1.p1  ORF type:complete len:331 (+),score=132.64 TRINITY_DN56186_c0_g1_i1:38-994(+)